MTYSRQWNSQKKTVGRWVLRRGIRIISTPIDGTIYPVYFDRPEIIHEIISSSKKYDIIIYKNDIRTVYYKEEKYEEIKEAITNSDTRKFIIYYDVHNPGTIITQPAEPMLFDREYIYPAFKTTLDENTIDRTEGYEYEYMEGIIKKADPFKISEYIDDMQYAHVTGDYKEKQRKENPQNTYLSIQATYKEKPDKDMLINKISSSDFITGKDTKTTLTYICGVFCFSAFIAGEFSYDPQKVYDFFRIFKESDKIKVKDLRKGSFGNMNKLTIPEKDTVYEMSPNTLYFYELMKNIGIPEKKIIEWNMENKITAVSKNKSKKGVQPIYIDSIEKIINPETSISMTDAFTAEKIELQSGTSIKTLTESINRQHIHKFILTDQLSFTEITTLYPVRYKDTYIYPSFRNKYSNHFIDKLSLSTFIYYINMDENRKTSDIIFADENKTIRATESDDTR